MELDEKPAPPPVYKNRQTVVGFIVRPKQQARIAMVFTAGTWVMHLVLMAILVPKAGQLDSFEISLYLVLSALCLTVFAIVTGVILSHRLYGPLVSIKRHIAHLREGDYSARLQLRSSDDMSEMRDSLNDLAAALESRHGSGKKTPS
jgi:signal transduction histidine kinase